MNFDLSDDQRMLVDTAKSWVKKDAPISRSRKLREEQTWSKQTWKQFGDLGWLALPFSEAAGGLGSPFIDTALVLEQLGTTLVPEPILAACVFAGTALENLATPEQLQRYLAPMIAGDTSLALAVTERTSRYDLNRCETTASQVGGNWKVKGEKIWVLNGHMADHILVSATTSKGLSLFALPKANAQVTPVKTMDGRGAAFITFANADAELIGEEGQAGTALSLAFDRAAAGACAEAYGLLSTTLAMTVEYMGVREQFGTKIGSFQALQHRAVDMFVETELAKSSMILAALKHDVPYDLSQAKIQIGVSGRFVTQNAIQLHGGVGVTEEHDVGLYFKRMQIITSSFGDEEFHLQRMTSAPEFIA